MDPRQFGALAERLVSSGLEPRPARNRSAVSRAYYAGFLVAREFLRTMSIHIPKSKDAHMSVPTYLRYSNDDDLKVAATTLETLRGRRTKADYDMQRREEESDNVAQDAVDEAKEVISTLDGCSDPSRRTAIATSINANRTRASGGMA